MKLGVMSDTHGNLDLMQRAADRMVNEFHVDAIVHLGDDCADAATMERRNTPLFAVPGMYEAAWNDGSIPHRRVEDFGGVLFMLSHTPTKDGHDFPGDLKPEQASSKHSCRVLMHGHTHAHRAVEGEDGLIIICPGHLKSAEDRGRPASFAIVDVNSEKIEVDFYEASGSLFDSSSFVIGGSGR